MDFLVTQGKYLGIILFLILTGCGMPIPEEVPIVLAGVLSAQQMLNPWLAYASCLIGALIGDAVMYAIGYHWGHGLMKAHPRLARFLRADREEKFEDAIQRHGFKVMLIARFMVGVRGPVYLASGVIRMPFRRFLMYDLVAATLVVSLFYGLSYRYGDTVVRLIRNAEVAITIVVVASVAVVLGFVYWRRRRLLARTMIQTATGSSIPGNDSNNADERADSGKGSAA